MVCMFLEGPANLTQGATNTYSASLLHRLRNYFSELGTQVITIPPFSLVEDMLQTYESITSGLLEPFSWQTKDLGGFLEDFIFTRDCFILSPSCAPAVQATFSVDIPRFFLHRGTSQQRQGEEMLDVNVDFTWQPPVVSFHNLQNVVNQGDRLVLKPLFHHPQSYPHSHSHRPRLQIKEEYVLGSTTRTSSLTPSSDSTWGLVWDPVTNAFRGVIPDAIIASQIGMQRADVYTVPLELTATIEMLFPAGVRLERVMRCVVPLTVKRRPEDCLDGMTVRMRSPEAGWGCISASPRPSEKECCEPRDAGGGTRGRQKRKIRAIEGALTKVRTPTRLLRSASLPAAEVAGFNAISAPATPISTSTSSPHSHPRSRPLVSTNPFAVESVITV